MAGPEAIFRVHHRRSRRRTLPRRFPAQRNQGPTDLVLVGRVGKRQLESAVERQRFWRRVDEQEPGYTRLGQLRQVFSISGPLQNRHPIVRAEKGHKFSLLARAERWPKPRAAGNDPLRPLRRGRGGWPRPWRVGFGLARTRSPARPAP
jgi:hypothetical protein